MTGAKTQRPQGTWKEQAMQFLEPKMRWREGRRSEASGRDSDHAEPVDQSSIYSGKAIGESCVPGRAKLRAGVRTGTRWHSLALVELTF